MTKIMLFHLILTGTSIYLAQCSKITEKSILTTTEASLTDPKSAETKSMINSKSLVNNTDEIDVLAVMTMCNESFRIEMSFLESLNESGSFPDETDKTPKCFLRCMLQSLEIASLDDGKIDPERAAFMFAAQRNKNPEDLMEITTDCAQRDEKCRCEMAYNFAKCVISMDIENGAKKLNPEPKEKESK